MIPEERCTVVRTKYFDDILEFAESLLHVDASFLDQHREESGLSLLFLLGVESFEESVERLHTTSELVYTFLLDLKIPLSQNAVSLYRTALLNSRAEVIETGHVYTLSLCMKIAQTLSWRELFDPAPQLEGKFRKAIRQLLFENGPSKPEPTREHLNSILGLWICLSRW